MYETVVNVGKGYYGVWGPNTYFNISVLSDNLLLQTDFLLILLIYLRLFDAPVRGFRWRNRRGRSGGGSTCWRQWLSSWSCVSTWGSSTSSSSVSSFRILGDELKLPILQHETHVMIWIVCSRSVSNESLLTESAVCLPYQTKSAVTVN